MKSNQPNLVWPPAPLSHAVTSENNLPMGTYEPEIWRVEKDTIYSAIKSVADGLEFIKSALLEHDTLIGRDTLMNKTWAECMENYIRQMERTLAKLKECG